MKTYNFVGVGRGVPGLPHVIKKSDGDQWIKDFEKAVKVEDRADELAKTQGSDRARAYLSGMPGAILKGALANGNYAEGSDKKKPDVKNESEV